MSDNTKMTKTKVSSVTLDAGKYYTMGELTFEADTRTNLSANGTANSYIISSAGNYSFTATVVGNGVPGYLGLSTDDTKFYPTSPSISPSSAALLWQDVNGLISSVNYSGGKVTFTASGSEGNAVIAVYDNSTLAKILWSWHIWCTDAPTTEVYTNADSRTFTVMDRNLGATSKTPADVTSKGLLYQWGRKDPFPSSSRIDGNDEPLLYNAANPGGSTTLITNNDATSYGTIEKSVQNPTSFIKTSSDPYDWYNGANRNNHLWGNPYGDNYEGKIGVTVPYTPDGLSGTSFSPRKSIYDPCPPGYMVAPCDTWTFFGGVYETPVNHIGDNSSFVTNKGYKFKRNSSDAEGTWYPASGCRECIGGTLIYASSDGCYWSSGPRLSGSSNSRYLHFYNSKAEPKSESTRAMGFAVRCVTE